MQRDMNLVKKLLEFARDHCNDFDANTIVPVQVRCADLGLPATDINKLKYHIALLVQSRFVTTGVIGSTVPDMFPPAQYTQALECSLGPLTWEGHNLLEKLLREEAPPDVKRDPPE